MNSTFRTKHFNKTKLLIFFLCTTMMSVGFSSWLVVEGDIVKVEVGATVEDVFINDVFSISKITTFSLGPDGLVEDETIVKSASINATFTINNANARLATNENNINFSLILSCSNQVFISTYIELNPAVENSVKNETILNEGRIISDITFPILETEISTISIVYTVADKEDTPIKSFYPKLPTFGFRIKG